MINGKPSADSEHVDAKKRALHPPQRETAFGRPRDFLNNHFVYAVVSSRAHGLSLGINVNPDKFCNFDCVYCEVDRRLPSLAMKLDVAAMAAELRRTLAFVHQGRLRELPEYHSLPDELLQLRHVALSGDGEPTLAPDFADAVEAVIRVRALGGFPFFKLVLITNAAGFDQPQVQKGLEHFTKSDEIWAKLDGGTQEFLDKVNRPKMPLVKTLANILALARQRPVIIQSLFAVINGEEPPFEEI
ncbi:MAG TPA: radical SAM protein, partial [Candidatus Baltobacteraceae bacterium]|nr:radical SAM protein [Candidatus Baltobacteraceae bacterium]